LLICELYIQVFGVVGNKASALRRRKARTAAELLIVSASHYQSSAG